MSEVDAHRDIADFHIAEELMATYHLLPPTPVTPVAELHPLNARATPKLIMNRYWAKIEISALSELQSQSRSDRVNARTLSKFPGSADTVNGSKNSPLLGKRNFPPLVVKRPRLSTPPGCVTEVPPFSFPSGGNSLP